MKKTFLLALLALPGTAFAAPANLTELINIFTNLIEKSIIPLFVALAVALFIWGIVTFIQNADSDAEREKGRKRMLWGVIALFVIVSMWGLVAVLGNTFGIRVGIPGAPGSGKNNINGSNSYFDTSGYQDCLKYSSPQSCSEKFLNL